VAFGLRRPGAAVAAPLGLAALVATVGVLGGAGRGATANLVGQLIALAAGTGAVIFAALGPAPRRRWGVWGVGAFAAFALMALASVAWSVQPDDTWRAACQLLVYLAIFGGAAAAGNSAPRRAETVVAGLLAGTTGVCLAGLATKVWATFDSADATARLAEPLGYWNALGLLAALGLVPALWLGTRRTGPAALRVLAFPIFGALVVTLALSISRGAIVAGALAVGVWLVLAPRRLRSVAVALAGSAAGGAVAVWAFGKDALTTDPPSLRSFGESDPLTAARETAGHQLGVALILMVAVLIVAGIAVERIARRGLPERTRRRAGRGLVALGILVVLAGLGAVAASQRGIGGTVTELTDSLTKDVAVSARNSPARLKSVSAQRGTYWRESARIWQHHKAVGAGWGAFGTARLKVRDGGLTQVRHAHGQAFELLSGLGAIGLLLGLVLVGLWLRAGARAIGLARGDRSGASTPERSALIALGGVALAFGAHAAVDWTFFIPGTAVVGLIAAGYLAGHGPNGEPSPRPRPGGDWTPGSLAVAGTLVLVAVATAWALLGPYRSDRAVDNTYAALSSGHISQARADAHDAQAADPRSLEALFALATVENAANRPDVARAALQLGTRIQPDNPLSWLTLAEHERDASRFRLAQIDAQRGADLDPLSAPILTLKQGLQTALAQQRSRP
jgi:hypothetical protein